MRAALESIDRSGWLINNMLIMPKHEAWIHRQVSVRRASGTTRIEGASLGEAEVEELRKKGRPGKLSDDERDNINALRAYELIDFLSDGPDLRVDELAIRQLNLEFLRGEPDQVMPGKYRNGQNTVGKFKPPDQGDVPPLMRAFAEWLGAEDEIHPILKAGITHIHLVAVHPFWDGNGRVARGVATLILQRSRFHFKRLLSLEAFLFRMRDQYFGAIERTLGTDFTPSYDVTPWLEFFTDALMVHAQELQVELTDWHRKMEGIYRALEKDDINHRQADGLVFAVRMGAITRADYIEIAGVSPVTASRDLARLVRKEWLVPRGETRGRVYIPYVPTEESEARRGPPPEQQRLFGDELTGQTREVRREQE